MSLAVAARNLARFRRQDLRCSPCFDFASNKCSFSTTAARKFIHPILWRIASPLAKITAAVVGRHARNEFIKASSESPRNHFLKLFHSRSLAWITGIGVSLPCLILVHYLSHLEATPITGRVRYVALSQSYVDNAFASDDFIQKYLFKSDEGKGTKILPQTHESVKRVERVLKQVIEANTDVAELQERRQWKIFVIRDPEISAFVYDSSIPEIYVSANRIAQCENDDQLAITITHEMAHACLGHAREKLSHHNLITCLLVMAAGAIGALTGTDVTAVLAYWLAANTAKTLVKLPYSRTMEREADEVGLLFAAKACYDIREGPARWYKEHVSENSSAVRLPTWPAAMSTHPSHLDRVKHLDEIMPKYSELRRTLNCPCLQSGDPIARLKRRKLQIDKENEAHRAHLLELIGEGKRTSRSI